MIRHGLFIAMLLALAGAPAHAVPQAAQAGNAGTAAAPAAPGEGDAGRAGKKAVRRCARRSRLGICERWNMPKSAVPANAAPAPTSGSRNPPAKH